MVSSELNQDLIRKIDLEEDFHSTRQRNPLISSDRQSMVLHDKNVTAGTYPPEKKLTHDVTDKSKHKSSPSLLSTERFLTTWLSGAGTGPSEEISADLHIQDERNTMDSSFLDDSFSNFSNDDERIASSLPKSPMIGYQEKDFSRSPLALTFLSTSTLGKRPSTESETTRNYREGRFIDTVASFDSLGSYSSRGDNDNSNSEGLNSINTRRVGEGPIRIGGRPFMIGSPIDEEGDNASCNENSMEENDSQWKDDDGSMSCASKVRRLHLDDRPHLRNPQLKGFSFNNIGSQTDDAHTTIISDVATDTQSYSQFYRRQLFMVLEEPNDVNNINKGQNGLEWGHEISPKDVLHFPEEENAILFMKESENLLPCPGKDGTPPRMNHLDTTPKTSKKSMLPATPLVARKGAQISRFLFDRPLESDGRSDGLLLRPSSSLTSASSTVSFNELNQDSEQQQKLRSVESRFNQDFQVVGTIGDGSFGTVYKCLSRLDGCTYAVKAAKRPAKGNADRDRMLKEVHALAALSDLTDPASFHIVRYHQAWMEENRLYIQTELCTSTVAQEIRLNGAIVHDTHRKYKLLREMSLALELIHREGLVHLDIKPDNIFIKNDQYKLGDFGLVNKSSVRGDIEEGDSRYMALDLLTGDQRDLTKCDIFSLGISIYEICVCQPLPMDGQTWQDIRMGILSPLPHIPPELQVIVRDMMNPDPSMRPTASSLLLRRQLLSEEQKKLILEQNRVREATLALKAQEARLLKLTPPKTLMRSNTWNGR